MNIIFALVVAIAPSLVLVRYFYKQDLKKPEPKGLITKIFFLGFIFTVPACIFEMFVDEIIQQLVQAKLAIAFLQAFFMAALIEETIKLFIVKKFAYNHTHFDEEVDGIIYAIVASLGFACMENLIYVIDGGLSIAFARAFSAVPLHALSSGMMGYYIGKAKFAGDKKQEKCLLLKGLWFAILIHGVYDFLIFASPELGIIITLGIFPLLVITFIKLNEKIKLAITADTNAGRHPV
jgi:RsiW-degrading membrane proteinase PrsW (M82 family)